MDFIPGEKGTGMDEKNAVNGVKDTTPDESKTTYSINNAAFVETNTVPGDTGTKNLKAASLDTIVRRLGKNWITAKKAAGTWNVRDVEHVLGSYENDLSQLKDYWSEYQTVLAQEISGIRQYIGSKEYPAVLETALKEAGIPLSGSFPRYELPPFRLNISVEHFEVKLMLGKKQETTAVLYPKELARWVLSRYRKLINRKFDAPSFIRDLIEAYRFANMLAFREQETEWGRAVSLERIYELLTLKRSTRQDYPKQFYCYDLGRLKENPGITYEEYRLELGFQRDQSKAITIVDSKGKESRVSSLTVYKEGGVS